jgi:helix-turn-helix, type 11 domain-containing protein
MGFSKEYREEIKKFIIDTIDMRENPYKKVLEKYLVSRQTVSKYIKELLEENIIEKKEKNEYQLKFYVNELKKYSNKDLEEDIIYNEFISEYEKDKKENIRHILNYTFTEMLNNAIEHSSGNEITIFYTEDYKRIFVYIEDNGIGIFRKIKEDHNLENENQAIFELQKGKLTSDAENHSGEGIFFTSKVVDFFQIKSFDKEFYTGNAQNLYNFQKIENIDNEIKGTSVLFILDKNTERTTFQVFQEYTDDNYVFDKTTITVHLAKEYMGESFMSRSQARRILLNAEKFRIIFLDFSEVDIIGQAFADEIFRVYINKNPDIQIIPINANAEVDFMIKRSQR